MSDASSTAEATTARRFDASRGQLTGEALDAGTDLAAARSVVSSADRQAELVLLSAGDARRVDLWQAGGAIVLHAFATDPSAVTAGTVATGSAAWTAVASVIAQHTGATSSPPVEPAPPATLEFADLESFALDATGADGSLSSAAVLSFSGSGVQQSRLLLGVGATTWWGRIADDGPVRLVSGRDAELWAAVLRELGRPR